MKREQDEMPLIHRRRLPGEVATGSAWALVTGAGSGIGRCFALQLAALGYNLVIVGNNPAPIEATAEEIRSGSIGAGNKLAKGRKTTGSGKPGGAIRNSQTSESYTDGVDNIAMCSEGATDTENTGGNITDTKDMDGNFQSESNRMKTPRSSGVQTEVRVISLDLARAEAAQELFDRVAAEGIEIDVLINNAGIFSFCDILTTPAERIERLLMLHTLTNTQMCRLFAADMARRGVKGHILNMSSYSLWMPFPGLSLYSASKAYLRSFSVAFAKEVREKGIRVTALCPAGVQTDLFGLTPRWQRIARRTGFLITAESCARRGLRAMWRGKRCVVPDWWMRAWIPLCKILPMWMLKPVRKFTMKLQK